MKIEYTTERRPDTNVTNVQLGVWLFLASEVMLFGALFSSYALLRVSAASWPSGGDVLNLPLGWTNTVILFAATQVIWSARRLTLDRARTRLIVATAMTLVFVVIKAVEYSQEISAGLLPSTNTYLAMYFTLTGLHALHVIGGVGANVWAITGARPVRMEQPDFRPAVAVGPAVTLGRVRALSLYWIFVDVIWMVMFVLLYLS